MSREQRVVVIASRNADKQRELGELFAGLPFDVRSAADYPGLPDVIEDGTTIVGNSQTHWGSWRGWSTGRANHFVYAAKARFEKPQSGDGDAHDHHSQCTRAHLRRNP